MQKNRKLFRSIKGMTIAAMLVAMSVVIGIFCKTRLNIGDGPLRVTFENIPIIMAGVLYGPVVGGLVGACSDLVSCLFSGYAPNIIVMIGAATVGAISGITCKFFVRQKGRKQIIVSGIFAHILGSMIIKSIGLYQYYGVMVLWRIPIYLVIAPIEIFVICLLFDRASFCRAVGYVKGEKNELS